LFRRCRSNACERKGQGRWDRGESLGCYFAVAAEAVHMSGETETRRRERGERKGCYGNCVVTAEDMSVSGE
jgi:hypothetical protein